MELKKIQFEYAFSHVHITVRMLLITEKPGMLHGMVSFIEWLGECRNMDILLDGAQKYCDEQELGWNIDEFMRNSCREQSAHGIAFVPES